MFGLGDEIFIFLNHLFICLFVHSFSSPLQQTSVLSATTQLLYSCMNLIVFLANTFEPPLQEHKLGDGWQYL